MNKLIIILCTLTLISYESHQESNKVYGPELPITEQQTIPKHW